MLILIKEKFTLARTCNKITEKNCTIKENKKKKNLNEKCEKFCHFNYTHAYTTKWKEYIRRVSMSTHQWIIWIQELWGLWVRKNFALVLNTFTSGCKGYLPSLHFLVHFQIAHVNWRMYVHSDQYLLRKKASSKSYITDRKISSGASF